MSTYINLLSATGLKSGDFDHKLTPLNVIIGDNFTGKTSVLDAVRLALAGYLPELGKTASATKELARDGKLTVNARCEDGTTRQRTWNTVRGTFKASEIGIGAIVNPVLMDPSVYFSLGDKDRIRYVFGLSKMDDSKEFGCDAIIAKLMGIQFEEPTPEMAGTLRELTKSISESDFERHERGMTIQDWLTGEIDSMRDKAKLSKQSADSMTAAVRGIVAIQATEPVAPNVEPRLKAIEAELQKLREDSAILRKMSSDAQSVKTKRATIKAKLEKAVDHTEEIKTLTGLIDASTTTEPKPVDDAIQSAVNDAVSNRLKLEEQIKSVVSIIASERKEYEECCKMTCCPMCKSDLTDWKVALTSEYQRNKSDLEKQVSELADKLKAANLAIETAQKNLDTVRSAYQAAKMLWDGLVNMKDRRSKLILANSEIQHLRGALDALGTDTDDLTIETCQGKAQQNAARSAELETERNGLEDQQRAYNKAKAESQTQAQAIQRHKAAMAEALVYREALKVLEAHQSDMVSAAFGTILERANMITRGLLKAPLEYRDCDIGMQVGGAWVVHRVFSGMEKALAYAGISVALAWDSPIKIVMIDEMGRFSRKNKVALLDRMNEMILRGSIDQFIGVDVDGEIYKGIEGVNVIEV